MWTQIISQKRQRKKTPKMRISKKMLHKNTKSFFGLSLVIWNYLHTTVSLDLMKKWCPKHQKNLFIYSRDNTHMTSMKIVQFWRPLPHVYLRPTFSLDLGRPISNKYPSQNNTMYVNERYQNKTKPSHARHIQINHAFFHQKMAALSESKGRFLVSNILMFGSA